ncbi:serine hydrolase domain-containing protein [Robiginitomaculum antarcticum]|uniref:serine hydrolase domain-containing protein n=1 Tax=Robiginitomaculum antarcticum TaxID=437507 RepID=UPI000363A5A6|nr:serine hydrolase domain-containing protein [Robiginitomaculum antarcticum]
MRALLLTGVCVAILAGCSEAPTQTAQAEPAAIDIAEAVNTQPFNCAAMDEAMTSTIATGRANGLSALVYDDGQVVYKKAFGKSDVERDTDMSGDTVVRIYSMTKPVTAAIIMQMVEEGKISLDDPVKKWIPQIGLMQVYSGQDENGAPIFKPQDTDITIAHLLTHTSGLGYGLFGAVSPLDKLYADSGILNPDQTNAEKMDMLPQLPLMGQPGTIWYYGLNLDVAGRVAEMVDDKPLSEVMQSRLFTPLGMTDTGFAVGQANKARFASTYAVTENGLVLYEGSQTSPFIDGAAWEGGGGGLVSTLDDYSKFAEMLLNGGSLDGVTVLKPQTVDMMMSDQTAPGTKFLMPWFEDGAIRQGFGGTVVTGSTPQLEAAKGFADGQYSWGGAARTHFVIDPDANSYAILFMQQFEEPTPPLFAKFRSIARSSTAGVAAQPCTP